MDVYVWSKNWINKINISYYFLINIISHDLSFNIFMKHQGRCITFSSIRTAGYFIHKAFSTIKKFLQNCVMCRKLRLPLAKKRMSDLPEDRLHCSPLFAYVGLDVFGPFEVSDVINTRWTHAAKKSWAVAFTCLNSRATHREPLHSLDVNRMKNALRTAP